MSKRGCLLAVLVASTQLAPATADRLARHGLVLADTEVQPTATATLVTIPTVIVPTSHPVFIPTVTVPQPTPTPTATAAPTSTPTSLPTATPTPVPILVPPHHHAKPHHHPAQPRKQASPPTVWITAYLTSYCPGSAGWLASSGQTVFYGMLANDFYPFGTRVYIPVIGITGVVEDRIGAYNMWNHFDVWSPVCYSTPTGWYKVAVMPH